MNMIISVGRTYVARNGKNHTITGVSVYGNYYSDDATLTWTVEGMNHQNHCNDLVVAIAAPTTQLTEKGKARAAILYALADGVPIQVKTDVVRTWSEATPLTVLDLLHQRASMVGTKWRAIEFRVKPEIPDAPVTKEEANTALHNLLGCPDVHVAQQLGDSLRRFIEEAK